MYHDKRNKLSTVALSLFLVALILAPSSLQCFYASEGTSLGSDGGSHEKYIVHEGTGVVQNRSRKGPQPLEDLSLERPDFNLTQQTVSELSVDQIPQEGEFTLVLEDPMGLGDWHDCKSLRAALGENGEIVFEIQYYGGMPAGSSQCQYGYIYMDTDQDETTGYERNDIGADYEVYYEWYGNYYGWSHLYRWNETEGWFDYVSDRTITGVAENGVVYVFVPLEEMGYPTSFDLVIRGYGYTYDEVDAHFTYTSGSANEIVVDGDPSDWDGIPAIVTDDSDSSPGWADLESIYITDNSTHLFFRRDTRDHSFPALTEEGTYLYSIMWSYLDVDQNESTGYWQGYEAECQLGFGLDESGWWDNSYCWTYDVNGQYVEGFDIVGALNSVFEAEIQLASINEAIGTGMDLYMDQLYTSVSDLVPLTGHGTYFVPPHLGVDVDVSMYGLEVAVVRTRVFNGSEPITGASVTANLTEPDDTIIPTFDLYDDGTHGDISPTDGTYTCLIEPTKIGSHRIRAKVVKGEADGTGSTTFYAVNLAEAATFLKSAQNGDGGFSDRGIWVLNRAVRALKATDALDEIDGDKAAQWIAMHRWPWGLEWTQEAVDILWRLDRLDAIDEETKDDIIVEVVNAQETDGSFYNDLRDTFWVVRILRLLDALDEVDQEATINYIVPRQNADGGFSWSPGDSSYMEYTFFAVLTLKDLGALESADQEVAIDWIASCQSWEGGFGGRPGYGSDLSETYRAIASLEALDGLSAIDMGAASNWLAELQNPDGGFEYPWQTHSAMEWTCRALETLKTLDGLHGIDLERAMEYLMNHYDDDLGVFMDTSEITDSRNVVQGLFLLDRLDEINTSTLQKFIDYSWQPSTGGFSNNWFSGANVEFTNDALQMLSKLNKSNEVETLEIINFLADCQRRQGGFGYSPGDFQPLVKSTLHGIEALSILNTTDHANKTALVNWLASCQNPDGGFGNRPEDTWSRYWETYHAICALYLSNNLSQIDRDAAIEYLVSIQQPDGSIDENIQQTYGAIYALNILESLDQLNTQKILQYLYSCQNLDGGFDWWPTDEWSWLDSTRYGLHAMMLLSQVPGTISGIVVDELGQPLQEANVTAFDKSGWFVAKTYTDPDGLFSLTLPEGNYTLWCIAFGKQAERRNLLMPAGDQLTVDFTLLDAGETSTTTKLSSSPSSTDFGREVTLTITTTSKSYPKPMEGAVIVYANGTEIFLIDLSDNTGKSSISKKVKWRPEPGSWRLTAAYSGDNLYSQSQSTVQKLSVRKLKITMKTKLSKSTIHLGDTAKLDITLSASSYSMAITGSILIEYRPYKGQWATLDTINLAPTSGKITVNYEWQPQSKGKYDIKITYTGNNYYTSYSSTIRLTVS